VAAFPTHDRCDRPRGDRTTARATPACRRFEVARRRPTLPHPRGNELEDIATEAADYGPISVLRRLDDFRGGSRFTTWAYRFALLEAAVKLRKRPWQGTRGVARARRLGPILECRPRARRRGRTERAARNSAERDRTGSDAAPATRARRPGPQRRPDRCPGRAAEHQPRPPFTRRCTTGGESSGQTYKSADSRSTTRETMMERPDLKQAWAGS
jgi:hypothetical protein